MAKGGPGGRSIRRPPDPTGRPADPSLPGGARPRPPQREPVSREPFRHDPPGSDPLADVELVLIDANNLIGALGRPSVESRSRGPSAEPTPPAAVIGRVRGAIPAGVRVELIFDGPPRGGIVGRLATGFSVRYSGRTTADSVIVDVVSRQAAEHGPASTWSILVVTDDRELRDQVRARGARSAAAAWLARRISTGAGGGTLGKAAARSGTSIGHGRPPSGARAGEGTGNERSSGAHGGRPPSRSRGRDRRSPC